MQRLIITMLSLLLVLTVIGWADALENNRRAIALLQQLQAADVDLKRADANLKKEAEGLRINCTMFRQEVEKRLGWR